jgi:hypothetical protein
MNSRNGLASVAVLQHSVHNCNAAFADIALKVHQGTGVKRPLEVTGQLAFQKAGF